MGILKTFAAAFAEDYGLSEAITYLLGQRYVNKSVLALRIGYLLRCLSKKACMPWGMQTLGGLS